jgi:hypothetical protein
LERLIRKCSLELQKKGIKDLHFYNGKPYIIYEGLKFRYIPDSRGGVIHVLSDIKEKNIYKTTLKHLRHDSTFVDVGGGFKKDK